MHVQYNTRDIHTSLHISRTEDRAWPIAVAQHVFTEWMVKPTFGSRVKKCYLRTKPRADPIIKEVKEELSSLSCFQDVLALHQAWFVPRAEVGEDKVI